jgi:hypothetical protein
MKKILSIAVALLFISTGIGFACSGSSCFQTASQTAIAAPYFTDGGGPGTGMGGGWGVTSEGWVGVDSYAQGTKSAEAGAFATGTAAGDGWYLRVGHNSPAGFASTGAAGSITLLGAGAGIGTDKKFFDTKDYASVGIQYDGFVGQGNGFYVGDGTGTGTGGFNRTRTEFGGGSSVQDHGKWWIFDIGVTPAVAINVDGGAGYAAGTTIGGHIATPTSAIAGTKTVGFSGHNGDYGRVWGEGQAYHDAIASNGGSYGYSGGMADFCYDSHARYGMGSAQSHGWTNINQTSNSTTVTSYGSSSSFAMTK